MGRDGESWGESLSRAYSILSLRRPKSRRTDRTGAVYSQNARGDHGLTSLMAFRGNFDHALDDRGRVAIPAKYRADFPNNTAVITPSPEGCLRVFPEAAFQAMSTQVAE